MAAQLAEIDAALDGLRTGFAFDGYDLVVDGVKDGSVHVRFVAGPDACEDCLVPKDTMRAILGTALKGVSGVTEIALTYPADADHSGA